MNTAQVTACQPQICGKNICQLHWHYSKQCVLPMSIKPCSRIQMSLRENPSFGLKCHTISKSRKPLRICLAGGKGMMGNNDENSPWKSIQNAMEKFKGQSIEEVLRQQLQKGGGSGARPPGGDGGGGDGGGGGGGGPDGTGGPEDESFAEMLDENLQVILATGCLLFLYVYLITGKELLKLIRDYVKYLFGGGQSVRLKTAMVRIGLVYRNMTEKKEAEEFWLEKAILNTPTWWYDPEDFRKAVKNCYASDPEPDEDEDEDEDE